MYSNAEAGGRRGKAQLDSETVLAMGAPTPIGRIRVLETAGYARTNEPVRIGIPVARGLVADAADLVLYDSKTRACPTQCRALARWADGSIKWLLLDALVDVHAGQSAWFTIGGKSAQAPIAAPVVRIVQDGARLTVDTGVAQFGIEDGVAGPLLSVRMDSIELLTAVRPQVQLRAADGTDYALRIERTVAEESGPVRASILVEGGFARGRRQLPLRFRSRLVFAAGRAGVRWELEVRNPQAARHVGGLWDLGDPGSCLFSDLSLCLAPAAAVHGVEWYAEDPQRRERLVTDDLLIYQDSSGGDNWDSPNHVDRTGRPTVSFPGYRVSTGSASARRVLAEGRRARPCLQVATADGWIAATTDDFWQNFPKALRYRDGTLSIGLFPSEACGAFELQGGEQKRHAVFIEFGREADACVIPLRQESVEVSVDAQSVERSQALPWFTAAELEVDRVYAEYVDSVVAGPHSFFERREVVDEYGWRNFGDLYADHEAVRHCGPKPLVSHYNNQYDFIFGALVRFLKTGDARWRRLMQDAARHTIDIDIYHTDQDKPAYNHGLFWHTDHHQPAATCTHRTYSGKNGGRGYGGGPSNEHNYTSGLLYYYYLSGDPEAAAAVVELADWVIAMDDGAHTLLGVVDDGPTGLATQTVSVDYHKPGRGAGNSINAMLDAYALTGARRYFTQAETFIQRCSHPLDDVAALGLDEPERRWSYLVFLQILGKYLATKMALGERDYSFHYARATLLTYADWMAQHEVPYKDVLHKVLLPTETWPAHDVRKCHVFHLAAQYSDAGRRLLFRDKAVFFFERCLRDVLSFDTAYCTRARVIMCTYGYVHAYFRDKAPVDAVIVEYEHDFGKPERFVPQRARVGSTMARKLRLLARELARGLVGGWRSLRYYRHGGR